PSVLALGAQGVVDHAVSPLSSGARIGDGGDAARSRSRRARDGPALWRALREPGAVSVRARAARALGAAADRTGEDVGHADRRAAGDGRARGLGRAGLART